MKAWFQMGLHESLAEREKAMAGLARWKHHEQWTKDNGQYIPMPGPFLRKERWNDGSVSGARAGSAVLAADDPLRAKIAALPADWWRIAGFDSKYDAEASRCNWMNYTEFRNRERVAPVEGAPA